MEREGSHAPIVGLNEACGLLKGGAVLAYPTETFYAVGCDARHPQAVSRVYAIKRRLAAKPLPLLAGSLDELENFCDLSALPQALLALWPAPLTVLVPPKGQQLAANLASPDGLLAVRISPHPVARALSLGTGCLLTSSSANLSGLPPVRLPEELDPELSSRIDGIVEPCGALPAGGLASTIVALCGRDQKKLRILREGAIPKAALAQAGISIAD